MGLIKLSEDDEKKLLELFKKRFDLMKKKRDSKDKDVKRWLELYNMVKETKDYSWESNIFVGYTYVLMQTILAKLRAALLGPKRLISVESQSEDYFHSEQKFATYLDIKLANMKFRKKMRDVILASLKYPTGAIVKARWKYEVDTYMVREYPSILGIPLKFMPPVQKMKTEVVYDDPDMEHVSYWNFWIDPDATDIHNARDLIHRTIKDFSYVKGMEREGLFHNIDKLEQTSLPKDVEVWSDGEIKYDDEDESTKGFKEVELMEWWTKYDINRDGVEENIIVTVGNRNVINKVMTNDHYRHMKTFKLFRPLREDNELYQMCIPQMLEDLQNELNDIRNMRMDNMKILLRKIFRARIDADIDADQIFAGPGNVIWLNELDDVQEFEVKDNASKTYPWEMEVKNDMQQHSAATDYNMGTSAGRGINNTATGISIITSEAASRFKEMADNLRDDTIEYVEMIHMLLKQYKIEDEVLRIQEKNEPKWDKMTLEELWGNYYIKLDLESMNVNKEMEKQQWVSLMNVLGRFPFINVRALVRTVLEKFEVKNINEIMNFKDYQKEIATQIGAPGGQIEGGSGISPPGEAEKTPEQRINEQGTIGTPLDPTYQSPIKDIPQLEMAKAMAGLPVD